jgi:hypothetical protein
MNVNTRIAFARECSPSHSLLPALFDHLARRSFAILKTLRLRSGQAVQLRVLPPRSLFSGDEPRNAGLYDGVESDPRGDSITDLPHGVFRNGGDFKVLFDAAGGF